MTLPIFTSGKMGQREPEFLAWVAILQALDVRSYVELGTGHAHYIREAGVPTVVTVDINTLAGGARDNGVEYISGDSHDPAILAKVLTFLGGDPDAVFIDADHDLDAPRKDFDLWWPHATKVCGFHDILIPNIENDLWPDVRFRFPSISIIGHDIASAKAWQGPGTSPDGRISGGGIGVLFKARQ